MKKTYDISGNDIDIENIKQDLINRNFHLLANGKVMSTFYGRVAIMVDVEDHQLDEFSVLQELYGSLIFDRF